MAGGDARSTVLTYDEYTALRYVAPLDGLRAVCVLLVLTLHVNSHLWRGANGAQGVAVFFVISGYLITTLCLREIAAHGSFSVRAFYTRRACRIFPLYFIVLGAYVLLDIGLNVGGHAQAMSRSLPWYATYMNDVSPYIFSPSTPFTLSWSLGVEEKFYLVWPFVGFVLWKAAPRLRAGTLVVLLLVPFVITDSRGYYLHYSQILAGCLLALALAYRPSFDRMRAIARHPWLVLAAMVTVHVLVFHSPSVLRSLYALVAAMLVFTLAVGDAAWVRALASRPMVFIGKRAYGIYLIQMLALGVCVPFARRAGVALNPIGEPVGRWAWPASLALFAAAALTSLAAAEVLHRTVERPFIELGRRLTTRMTGYQPVAPDRMRAGAPAGSPPLPRTSTAAAAPSPTGGGA